MKLITTTELTSTERLAKRALRLELYEDEWWTLHYCLEDVLSYKKVAESTEIFLLKDNKHYVGILYYNNKYKKYGVNTQIYIRDQFRKRGYGTFLYNSLVHSLKEKNISVPICVGSGVEGSDKFWAKMNYESEFKVISI